MVRAPGRPHRSPVRTAAAALLLGPLLALGGLSGPGAAAPASPAAAPAPVEDLRGGTPAVRPASAAAYPTAVAGPARAFTLQNDWNGDGHADVIAVSPWGTLFLYPGNGTGGFRSRVQIATGWTSRDQIRLVGNFDGTGGTDTLARSPSSGNLYLYRGTGRGTFGTATKIGAGWQIFREIIAPGDWTGDGRPDVLAVRTADHALVLYPGDGAGGWAPGARVIGTGWQTKELLTAVGDWDGDGRADFVARDVRTGDLVLYPGNGRGGFGTIRVIGRGWGQFTALLSPGDWSGDGRSDILARTCTGDLRLYRGTGTGGFAAAPYPTVGTGWHTLALTSPVPVGPAVAASLAGRDWEVLPTSQKVVALTFDGGASDGGLSSILATLKKEGVPATFFVTGDFARRYPTRVACLATAGYPVGNHSNTHPYFSRLTDAQIAAELWAAERAITAPGAPTARPLFRFPYGDRTSADIRAVNANGYVPVRWTVDSLGWKGTSGGQSVTSVTNRVVGAARPGAVVLMHVGAHPTDGSTLDAAALPAIIQRLRSAGYRFVTLEPYFG